MRVPFQVTPKGMEDTDKARDKVAFMIEVVEETGNDLIHSLKETIQERTVSEEEGAKFFSDGKNAVTMRDIY